MAIISGDQLKPKKKLKVDISKNTLDQIQKYCEWASIQDLGFFIEEASMFVFSKDKEWKKKQKISKKK